MSSWFTSLGKLRSHRVGQAEQALLRLNTAKGTSTASSMMQLKNISDYILTGDTINLWIPLLSWIPRRYVLLILPQCLHSISLVQVFLSATLPDNLMPTFLTCVGLASTLVEPPMIIKQLCFRPELAHHVVHVPLDTPLS